MASCCGDPLITSPPPPPPPVGPDCLRVAYECQCLADVDTWVQTLYECVPNVQCTGQLSCTDLQCVIEQFNGCVIGDPLPPALAPFCDPLCCSSDTSTTSTTTTTPPPPACCDFDTMFAGKTLTLSSDVRYHYVDGDRAVFSFSGTHTGGGSFTGTLNTTLYIAGDTCPASCDDCSWFFDSDTEEEASLSVQCTVEEGTPRYALVVGITPIGVVTFGVTCDGFTQVTTSGSDSSSCLAGEGDYTVCEIGFDEVGCIGDSYFTGWTHHVYNWDIT